MADKGIFNTAKFAGSSPATTGGWDTVYAVKADVINASLRDHFGEHGDLADKLKFEQYTDDTHAIGMTGRFGAWQITTGGSGSTIFLKVPIVQGQLTIKGMNFNPDTFDLAGASFIVQVPLGYHPVFTDGKHEPGRAALKIATTLGPLSAGSAKDLAEVAAAPPATTPHNITVSEISWEKHPEGLAEGFYDFIDAFAKSLAKKWFESNLWVFDYVFLSVDVAETAAVGEWDWIKPTYVGFAYTDILDGSGNAKDVEHSIFAIMSLTEGRLPSETEGDGGLTLTSTVSASAIPKNDGVNAAFLVRDELFLEKILLRNVPALFDGGKPDTFCRVDGVLRVQNASALKMTLEMDKDFYPFSDKCIATLPAGSVQVTMEQNRVTQAFTSLSFPYGHSSEMNVEMTLASYSSIGLDKDNNFTMQYGATTSSTIAVQPNSKQMAWDALKSIGINVVTTLLLSLTFGAGKVAQEVKAGTQVAEELLGPAEQTIAKEITTEVQQGAASVTKSLNVVSEAANVGISSLETEIGQSAKTELVAKGSSWTLKGIMPRLTFKVWAMIAGQFASEAFNSFSSIDMIRGYDIEPGEIPTMEKFLARCVKPAKWNNTGNQQLVTAGLNGSLVMGFHVPGNEPKVKTGA